MQVIIQEQETTHVMYMIWQVIFLNGQQRLLAIPTFIASLEEAITTVPTSTRAVAATLALLTASTTLDFAHFYICRTEL